MGDFDSTADTLRHAVRVGELMAAVITELTDRAVRHDRSKIESPELETFNEFTPKLRASTYGSEEYKGFLRDMGTALQHHYAVNRHHPEHFEDGVNGMTLMDVVEMLADWRAAGERHADADMRRSLQLNKERFGLSDQMFAILTNTADHLGWLR